MANKRRATLASPAVIRYWMLGLLAWAALVFVVAGANRSAASVSSPPPTVTLAPAPDVLIPMHVFAETRFRLLRANMTGDFSALVPVHTCGHDPELHAGGAVCNPFAGVPGLSPNNGPAPPWLSDLKTH